MKSKKTKKITHPLKRIAAILGTHSRFCRLYKYPKPRTIKPGHPDVLTWAEFQKLRSVLSETELKKYEAESIELWERYCEGPPRLRRTWRGAVVLYGQKELR